MYRTKCFNSRVFSSPEASLAHPGRGESALRPTSQNSFLRAARPLLPPRFVCWLFLPRFLQLGPTITPVQACVTSDDSHGFHASDFASDHLLYLGSTRVSNLPPRSRHAHRRPSLVLNQPERGACSHAAPLNPSADAKPPLTPDLSVPS